ncbi:hypothetical protein VC83_05774 [Pseudogymnoascus destructans]|uniref:Glycoside hydrolase family 31 TIM barrel domain-containing protein n=1 Tax=Pseudogymnoascus destructans TaxID=655981 RepID=A0A177A3Z7_9PEZI|nr:uncharacterized protein VC83_05774 [Pseudogymnoascus destructans]OAF56985.2 hypothetical protein VC83_05774 [Pseudogymnoascus destructans]
MPEYGLGFWLCKLRYQTQEELLEVASASLISSTGHYSATGSLTQPPGQIQATGLKSLNIELMNGYLIRVDRGMRTVMEFQGNTVYFDSTNPGARKYVWEKAKANYFDKGIKVFWLDEAEPEYTAYDFDNYRYHAGSNLAIGNIYPVEYARTFYEGHATCRVYRFPMTRQGKGSSGDQRRQ